MITQARAERRRLQIPGWFMMFALIATVAVTVFVMMRRNPDRWPASATEMNTWVGQNSSPAMGANQHYQVVATNAPIVAPGASPVVAPGAAPGAAPVIRAGARSKHADRGACALCHEVADAVGGKVPAIHAYSALPHPYNGGLCMNCHGIISGQRSALLPMAATTAVPATPVRQPAEAAWLGMEVSPITPRAAEQYSIPNGIAGVLIAEAEGIAFKVGLQAGDVVVAVNGTPTSDMATFVSITQNGALTAGSAHLLRGGKFFEVGLDRNAPPPPTQQPAAPAAATQNPQVAPAPAMRPMTVQPMPAPARPAPAMQPNPQQAAAVYPNPQPGAAPGPTCPNTF